MYYNECMDITIRNLDEQAYRRLKARAALEGRTVGELVNRAMRALLDDADEKPARSLRELEPVDFPAGNERLSEELDRLVYGAPDE